MLRVKQKTVHINGLNILETPNHPILGIFLDFFPEILFFPKKKKNLALSFFYSLDTTTSYQTS